MAIEYVAGGLAADTHAPMPMELQQTIQGYWRKIQAELGSWKEPAWNRTTFNAN